MFFMIESECFKQTASKAFVHILRIFPEFAEGEFGVFVRHKFALLDGSRFESSERFAEIQLLLKIDV